MKMPNKFLIILILCIAPVLAAAQENELKVPAEVASFVERNMKAIALEAADLNGDGKKDFILVLDRANVKTEDQYTDESDRPMLILVRGANDKLTLAAQNNEVVYCRNCGGVYGDPFDGVKTAPNSFTVYNVGGSSDRWTESYQFNYSRRDKTWQLVRAVFSSYSVFKPKNVKTAIKTPPKDFGKINFSDFSLSDIQRETAK